MTPTQFKALKPQFAAVSDARVQSYLDMAARIVFDPDDQDALAALTCHLMTLDGLGTDATSKSFATGAASYQSIKSGQLTLTRFQKAAGGHTDAKKSRINLYTAIGLVGQCDVCHGIAV